MAALRTRADDIRPYGPGSCHTALQTARQGCRALRLRRGPRCHNPPKFFRGMAPAAARRARPVQRGNDQGLRSDRCVPPRARQRLSRNPKGTGRGCTPGSCLLCTACRRHEPPYWGAQGGRSPPALLSLHFFGKKWGPRPGRPVPRGAPRCENVEPLIRPSVRTGAPSPCGGKASGGGYPPLRAWQLIRAPGPPPSAARSALQGVGRRVRDAAGKPRLSQIPSFWGILGRESKPFWRSSSVGI